MANKPHFSTNRAINQPVLFPPDGDFSRVAFIRMRMPIYDFIRPNFISDIQLNDQWLCSKRKGVIVCIFIPVIWPVGFEIPQPIYELDIFGNKLITDPDAVGKLIAKSDPKILAESAYQPTEEKANELCENFSWEYE